MFRDPLRHLPLWSLLACLVLSGSPLWEQGWAELQPGSYEPWRLVLGHWIHHAWPHLLWNCAALAGWLLLWTEPPLERCAKIALIGLLTGAGVSWVSDADYVVGLSGLLHGLYLASALTSRGDVRVRATSIVVVGGIAAKLGYEAMYGPTFGADQVSALPVATEAHLAGAAAGALYAFAHWSIRRARNAPAGQASARPPSR